MPDSSLKWPVLIAQLGEWFEEQNLLKAPQRWVVGVSGGPDSVLLLHALVTLIAERGLSCQLTVAHLNHMLRGAESDEDAAFVAKLAEELHLPFQSELVDIPAAVATEGGSTEELARERRYDFLERVALLTGSNAVLVAHHADDNVETIIHRICRGTGFRGLGGMSERRPLQAGSRVELLRPFLKVRRATIDALCAVKNLPFRHDSSNDTNVFTRGRIRNEVLPLLRTNLNDHVDEALLRLGEQARWIGTYLVDATERVFESLIADQRPRFVALNIRGLLEKQRIIQSEVIRHAVSLVMGHEQDLSFANVDAALRLASDLNTGKEVHLPGPVLIRKAYGRLEFQPLADAAPPTIIEPIPIECPGVTPLPDFALELIAELDDRGTNELPAIVKRNPNLEWIDFEVVKPPLYVRSRRDGDRFWPLGNPGTKSVSDFFIDEKVAPSDRHRVGVLCDQNGPLWVMGMRLDERAKITATTRRVLRLTLNRADLVSG